MKYIDIWYLIVIEKDYDDEDDSSIFNSYIDGMWDNYDAALNYVKAVRDEFRRDQDYDRVESERFFVEADVSGLIDYSIKIGTKTFDLKVRKKTVTITRNATVFGPNID